MRKISARNQLKGTVADVVKGATTSHVKHRHRWWIDRDRLDHQRGGRRIEARQGPARLRGHQGLRRSRWRSITEIVVREDEIRATERAIEWPDATDAGLIFIGRIHTPWTSRMECPRQGRPTDPFAGLRLFEPWLERRS